MGTTPNLQLPYPELNGIANTPADMQTLAASVDSYFSSAWQSFTPTVTPGSGAFGAVSGAAWWKRLGSTVLWQATITITTVGTAAGEVRFTLPVGYKARTTATLLGTGREHVATGRMLQVFGLGAGVATVYSYDNTSIIGANRALVLSGQYEIA